MKTLSFVFLAFAAACAMVARYMALGVPTMRMQICLFGSMPVLCFLWLAKESWRIK